MYCPTCSEEFSSERSMRIHHSMSHGESLAKSVANCVSCGDEFEYYPSSKQGKYCGICVEKETWGGSGISEWNKENKREVNKIQIFCNNCNQSILRHKSRINTNKNFCSTECQKEWRSENMVGENHPQYEGYNSNYSGSWWSSRREARERYNHQCFLCKKSKNELGQEPDIHHIIPVKEFDEERKAHYQENLVALCRKCHRNIEEDNINLPKDLSICEKKK